MVLIAEKKKQIKSIQAWCAIYLQQPARYN